jgi:hypothetical protein
LPSLVARHLPCVCVYCLWRSRWSRRSLGDPSHVGGVVTVVGTLLLVCQLGHWVLHLGGVALWEFCRLVTWDPPKAGCSSKHLSCTPNRIRAIHPN